MGLALPSDPWCIMRAPANTRSGTSGTECIPCQLVTDLRGWEEEYESVIRNIGGGKTGKTIDEKSWRDLTLKSLGPVILSHVVSFGGGPGDRIAVGRSLAILF